MPTQCYTVVSHSVETLLSWVKSGEIAIPEIQRPFVWRSTKVRYLLDSLYKGYPIGYLIIWKNPDVKLKDGSISDGKKILIDGQQRVTALMTSLLGREVMNSDYQSQIIRIAYNPQEDIFEVQNPAIIKNPAWIPDIAKLFSPEADVLQIVDDYCARNEGLTQAAIFKQIQVVQKIIYNQVGVIVLEHSLDIDTVTDIFIRVNSAGTELSQADFAMSKIAVNEAYGGNIMRRAIDYFCHMAVNPEFYQVIEKQDIEFARSEYYSKMRWLKDVNDDIYDPSYTDMLRVAFTSQFGRGKLQDLVSLISGRNFETKGFEDRISEESFAKLKTGIMTFINQNNFERFVMILRSAGFISSRMIGGQNALNFAYIIFLRARYEALSSGLTERLVRKWYAMSILQGRYSGSPESSFDLDIRQIQEYGLERHIETVLETELPDSFWTGLLPQFMNTSSSQSPYWKAYQAAQVKQNDKGFLSRDISVTDMLIHAGDVHHIFPKNYLKKQGYSRSKYNQIANFATTQSEINIAISDKAPAQYLAEAYNQCNGGEMKYGSIIDAHDLKTNLQMNCIPYPISVGGDMDYEEFLQQRRKLMALKIRDWYKSL